MANVGVAASFMRELAASWHPSFGSFSQADGAALHDLVVEARSGLDLVITHNRTYAATTAALETGVLGSATDHSAGLRMVGALAPGERSEDLLFATPQFVPHGFALDGTMPRVGRDPVFPERLGLPYGGYTFVLGPAALDHATAVPALWHETVEHFPGVTAAPGRRLDDVLAMRLAHDAGAWRASEAAVPVWRANAGAEQYPMEGVLELPHAAAVDATRGWLQSLGAPDTLTVELHVHEPTLAIVDRIVPEALTRDTDIGDQVAGVRLLAQPRGIVVPESP